MSRPREGEATAHDAVVGGEFSHQAETFHRFVASSLREHATFGVGDATDSGLPPASFDGAASRFALHHIPVPGRQEIERLRDPSHWMSLPAERLRELGAAAGLSLQSETVMPVRLDFEDWLARGSGGAGGRRLIERRLAERPAGSGCFRIIEVVGRRSLELATLTLSARNIRPTPPAPLKWPPGPPIPRGKCHDLARAASGTPRCWRLPPHWRPPAVPRAPICSPRRPPRPRRPRYRRP